MSKVDLNYMKLREELEKREKEYGDGDRVLGMNMLTFPGYISSSRGVMYGAHLKAHLTLNEPDIARVISGNENIVGKHSDGYKKAKSDLQVYARVSKFSHKPKHIYYLFLYDEKKDEYSVIEKKNIEKLTEKFGYGYNTEFIDSLEIGDVVEEGDVFYKSTSYDEFMNYRYGKNVNVLYQINNDTIEDAIRVRKGFAEKFLHTESQKIRVTLNDNDFFCNLYGDNDRYKGFPDLGEEINDSIICCKRRIFNNQVLYDLKKSVSRKINFNSDTPFYVDGGGILEDIDIYCNKPIDDIPDNPLNAQLKFYLKEQEKFYRELYDVTKQIINSGSKVHNDIKFLHKRARNILNPDIKWRDDDSIFSNMIIEFITVNRDVALAEGSKMTGRCGNKGVVSIIVDDEEMPYYFKPDGTKVYADIIVNTLGVVNRLNLSQLHEQSINNITNQLQEQLEFANWTLDEKEYNTFKLIEILSAKEAKALKKYYSRLETKSEKELFFETLVRENISIHMDPLVTDEPIFYKLMKCYKSFDWLQKYRDVYIRKWGRDIKIMTPCIIAPQYYMKLKQTSKKNFSCRSLSSINQSGNPSKSNSAKINQSLYPTTPIRILGEQEVINTTITMPLEDVSDMTRVYRNSLTARRKFGEELVVNLDEMDDFDINKEKDINTNVVILNAYFKAMGIRLSFSDNYYEIHAYDNEQITDYEDIETGEIVIDTEEGIDRYNIRKKLDEYYTNGSGFFIGTEENYQKLLDMEVENYIAARNDEPLPYPNIENNFDGFN